LAYLIVSSIAYMPVEILAGMCLLPVARMVAEPPCTDGKGYEVLQLTQGDGRGFVDDY
jgi:hypothetical protein